MDWRTGLLTLAFVLCADGFSKYGRTCKDIGCLPSQVCVLAEDPCSFGHTSNCGSYPTCKKKTAVEGSHAEQPSVPKPQPARPQPPPRDDAPNYPAPTPPARGSPYGGYQSAPVQNRNVGQSHARPNAATTYKPATYGWNAGVTMVLIYLTHQYTLAMMRT